MSTPQINIYEQRDKACLQPNHLSSLSANELPFQSTEFLGKEPDHLEGGSGNKKTADLAAQFHADVTN